MQAGFYISGVAGQMVQHKLDEISHNLANVNTVGYKATRSAFSTTLANQMQGGSNTKSPSAYVNYNNNFNDMREGNIKQTGNDLDFSIQGDAFFKVGLANGGEAYTRAGNFSLDAEGNLLTQSGHPVLSTNGSPIQLPPGHITASSEGSLLVDKVPAAELGLVRIKDAAKAEKLGEVLFASPKDNTAPVTEGVIVHQGALEESNVNAIHAITDLVNTMRNFQSTMKIIEQYDKQTGRLNDQVGRIQN